MQAIERAIEERCDASRTRLQAAYNEATRLADQMRLIRHGGLAIDALIPGTVYDSDVIPDIDVFTSKSNNSKKTTHAAAHLMKRAGIEGLRIVPAIHKSTYSIRLGRHVVMDVSWISPEEIRTLQTVSREEGHPDVLAAPAAYLKMSMHLELCRPAVYIERWRKVWPRLEAIYSEFPKCMPNPIPIKKIHTLEDVVLLEEDKILDAARDLGFVVVGRHAVQKLTGENSMSSWPVDLVLPSWTDDEDHIRPEILIDEFCDRLEMKRSNKPAAHGIFGPPYYRVLKNGDYVCRIHIVDTEVCTTTTDDDEQPGSIYGTSDLVLHLLYSEFLRHSYPHHTQRQKLAEVIDSVVESQKKNENKMHGIHRRFTPFNNKSSVSFAIGDDM